MSARIGATPVPAAIARSGRDGEHCGGLGEGLYVAEMVCGGSRPDMIPEHRPTRGIRRMVRYLTSAARISTVTVLGRPDGDGDNDDGNADDLTWFAML